MEVAGGTVRGQEVDGAVAVAVQGSELEKLEAGAGRLGSGQVGGVGGQVEGLGKG